MPAGCGTWRRRRRRWQPSARTWHVNCTQNELRWAEIVEGTHLPCREGVVELLTGRLGRGIALVMVTTTCRVNLGIPTGSSERAHSIGAC
jgi:hypothetical protein